MSHDDTATERWADLRAGDVRMMGSGSGISRIERRPAHADHPASDFTAAPAGDTLVTDLVGGRRSGRGPHRGLSVGRAQTR